MRNHIKAIGAAFAALVLVGVAVFYATAAGAADPTDTCTPGQTSDGCGGPADDGPPPHMDDQDDDGTDGAETPPPDQDLAQSELVGEILEFGAQLGLILAHIL
jgi:hypothetical protein